MRLGSPRGGGRTSLRRFAGALAVAWIALMAGVGCSSSDSAGKLNDADFANLNLGNVLQIQGILPADWIFVPQQAIPTKSITNFLPAGARDHVGGIGAVSFRKVNGDQIVVSGGVVVAWLNKDFNAPDAKKQAVELGGSGAVPDVRVGDTPVAKTLSWSTRTAEGRNDDVIQFVVKGNTESGLD